MPVIAVPHPYGSFDPGRGLPVITRKGVMLTNAQLAEVQTILDSDPRNRIKLVEVVNGVPQNLPETPFEEALLDHVNDETPHPVYDDGPSLFLLYENAKV